MAQLTVTDDGGVDDEGQEGLLVGSSVVLQQSSGVVITDGSVRGTLGSDTRGEDSRGGDSLEEHVYGVLVD